MLEGKIDTLLQIVISQSVVVFDINETIVNISLNFDAIIGDKSKFVTNIVVHEALMIENLSSSMIREASLDDVVVTKVTKLMATSSTPLSRRTRSMANRDLEALSELKKKEKREGYCCPQTIPKIEKGKEEFNRR